MTQLLAVMALTANTSMLHLLPQHSLEPTSLMLPYLHAPAGMPKHANMGQIVTSVMSTRQVSMLPEAADILPDCRSKVSRQALLTVKQLYQQLLCVLALPVSIRPQRRLCWQALPLSGTQAKLHLCLLHTALPRLSVLSQETQDWRTWCRTNLQLLHLPR